MPTQFDETNLQLGATETDYTDLGDITAPLNCGMITGICAEVAEETGNAAEGFLGTARLKITGAGEMDGIPVAIVEAVATGQVFYVPKFVPCNIPVKGGLTEIECSIKLSLAQTGTTEHGKVCLRFE